MPFAALLRDSAAVAAAPASAPRAASVSAATVQAAGAARAAEANIVRRLVFYLSLVFIFIRISLIHEIVALKYGALVPLPLIFGAPVVIGALLTGGVMRIFRYRTMYFWIAFSLWLIPAMALGSWRGGSFDLISTYFKTEFPMIFVMGGLAITWKDFRYVLYAICAGGLVNELTPRFMGGMAEGRLLGGTSTIGNSNDFAAHVLLLIPLFWLVMTSPRTAKLFRLVFAIAIGFGLFLVVGTASRGALVSLGVMTLFAVFRSSGKQRVFFALALPLAALIVVPFLPSEVITRITTFRQAQYGVQETEDAAESASARVYLLQEAAKMTLTHPIFGIGPGQFSTVHGFDMKAKGYHGGWSVTHNAYTEVSSETGIPGLIFFVGALISAFALLHANWKQSRLAKDQEVERAAFALMVAFISFCVSAFFLSMAYRLYFPTITGLIIAFANGANERWNSRSVAA